MDSYSNMKTIQLTRGLSAKVDDCDFDKISAYKWYAMKHSRSGKFYAARAVSKSKSRRIILMHAQIMCTPISMVTDHKDSDGLNNQRNNLRVCSNGQNLMNRGKTIKNIGQFKGVYPSNRIKNPWLSSITLNGKYKYIGSFKTEEQAAKAYDEFAKIYHGEFASLNFPT